MASEAALLSQKTHGNFLRQRTTHLNFIKTENSSSNFTIGYNNPFKTLWDIFVIILAVYNCICIPLSFSFEPPFIKKLSKVDFVVDLMYYADIIIAFRAQKLLDDGTLLLNNREIIVNYLRGEFTIDVIASFPFEILTSNVSYFNYTPVLKLMRVFRLVKIIKFLRVMEDVKASLKLLVMVFYLFVYLHFCTCIWWLVIKETKSWTHPSDVARGDL